MQYLSIGYGVFRISLICGYYTLQLFKKSAQFCRTLQKYRFIGKRLRSFFKFKVYFSTSAYNKMQQTLKSQKFSNLQSNTRINLMQILLMR